MIRATITRIVRIEDAQGHVYEQVKTEPIEISNLAFRVKKWDFDFRYIATGRGDCVMGLKEVSTKEVENAKA